MKSPAHLAHRGIELPNARLIQKLAFRHHSRAETEVLNAWGVFALMSTI